MEKREANDEIADWVVDQMPMPCYVRRDSNIFGIYHIHAYSAGWEKDDPNFDTHVKIMFVGDTSIHFSYYRTKNISIWMQRFKLEEPDSLQRLVKKIKKEWVLC